MKLSGVYHQSSIRSRRVILNGGPHLSVAYDLICFVNNLKHGQNMVQPWSTLGLSLSTLGRSLSKPGLSWSRLDLSFFTYRKAPAVPYKLRVDSMAPLDQTGFAFIQDVALATNWYYSSKQLVKQILGHEERSLFSSLCSLDWNWLWYLAWPSWRFIWLPLFESEN